ncbi:MAG: hypothetical protein DRJ51_04765 [Thermoprotei archaeon]|nr:MAG: hypothetical protein DRJ51_04765 [Thermoprotei archaeon]
MTLYTTHVGSYPLEFSSESFKIALLDSIKVGLDYPPHPQLRDFVKMFLEPLIERGIIEAVGETFKLVGKFAPEDVPNVSLFEQDRMIELLSRIKPPIRGKRACITGPFTLSSRIQERGSDLMGSMLANKRELDKMVGYVKGFVERAYKLGFEMIVVDEPILSVIIGRRILFNYSREEIVENLYSLFEGIKSEYRGIHVCGVLSPSLKDILLQVENINLLDHEHKDFPRNLDVYTREELETHDKFLALGVLSSKRPVVEEVEEIVEAIQEGLRRYGDRVKFIKGDCGFRGLRGYRGAYEISIRKLANLVRARKVVLDESESKDTPL